MPYFAYGSNLNADDLEAWSLRQNLPYPLGDIVGLAWLPDHRLVFDAYSRGRQGGVANVVPCAGYAVPGAVFKVRKGGWKALDRKEGAPGFYHRQNVHVLVEKRFGATEPLSCATYLIAPSGKFVPPSELYLHVVAQGYAARGLPPEQLECAARDQGKAMPLFVYGTLRRGGPLHARMEGFEFAGEASAPGRLLRCGWFPGLIAAKKGERVQGELYRVQPGAVPGEVLAKVDSVEGFKGFGDNDNLFERRIITATDGAGRKTPCWAYHWMGQKDLPVVAGGSWGG